MSTAPPPPVQSLVRDELQHLRHQWLLLLILGVGLVIVGTLAIVSSCVATLATVTIFGTLLFVGAVIELVNALTCRCWRGFVIHLLGGILYGVVGLIMMSHP